MLTTAYTDLDIPAVTDGVYAPQEDSQLLIDVMDKTRLARGHRVADLCTGSGVVALAACEQGAVEVSAFDICPRAVQCARTKSAAAGFDVAVHLGSWARSVEFGPYDLVVCNPPYVPHDPNVESMALPSRLGPARAWNAGADGRLVLDPLCRTAPQLLDDGGTMLVVQSEFAGVERSLRVLRDVAMNAEVVGEQWIPFGPVLSARARWLERVGRLEPGRRDERLVVIRADKP
jgi:release factor glutamine methyltransferase